MQKNLDMQFLMEKWIILISTHNFIMTSTQTFFCYDAIYHPALNTIVLFGKQGNQTICCRVIGCPYEVFYLQVNDSITERNQIDDSNDIFTEDNQSGSQSYKFKRTSGVKVSDEVIEKLIAPVVSFNVRDVHSDTDTPHFILTHDLLPPQTHRKEKNILKKQDELHRSSECKIRAIELVNYSKTVISKIDSTTTLSQITKQLFGSKFSYIWKETLDPLQLFCLRKHFHGWGYVCAHNCTQKIEPGQRLSRDTIEYEVEYANLEVLKESPLDTPHPILRLLYLHLEKNADQTHYRLSVSSDNACINSQQELIVSGTSEEPSDEKINLTKEQVFEILQKQLNEDTPDIIIAYKWNVLDSIHGTRSTYRGCKDILIELGLSINRAEVHTTTSSKGFLTESKLVKKNSRFGILWCDSFQCINQEQLFPRQMSYSLRSLRLNFFGQLSDQLSIAFMMKKLFFDHSILSILREWAHESCSLMQVSLDLRIEKSVESLLTNAFYAKNYILRAIDIKLPTKSIKNNNLRGNVLEEETTMDEISNVNHLSVNETKEEKLIGGEIFLTHSGVNDYVLIMDFMSTYPSIIDAANLCFSTIRINAIKEFRSGLASIDTLKRQEWRRNSKKRVDFDGVCPAVCRSLIDKRQQIKQMILQGTSSILDCRMKALKFIANSLYGCLAKSTARFFNLHFANYITQIARTNLSYLKSALEYSVTSFQPYLLEEHPELKFVVIGGHTDSLILKADGDLYKKLNELKNQPEQQYQLLYEASQIITQLVSEQLPGMKFVLESIHLCMINVHTTTYAAIPYFYRTNEETHVIEQTNKSIDQFLWKGLSKNQFGVAPFVNRMRRMIVSDLMTMLHAQPERSIDRISQIRQRLKNHIQELSHQWKTAACINDFILVNQFDARRASTEGNHKSAAQLQRQMWLDGADIEYIVHSDCIEYLACHDFTSYDDLQFLPLSEVQKHGHQLNFQWYLYMHLVPKLCEILEKFQIWKRDDLVEIIRNQFFKTKSAHIL